jgi:hypothetical protein
MLACSVVLKLLAEQPFRTDSPIVESGLLSLSSK